MVHIWGMKKILPDLKIRVDDALRAVIQAEVDRRKRTSPESAGVSKVVRDAIRAYLCVSQEEYDIPTKQGGGTIPPNPTKLPQVKKRLVG